MRYTFNQPCIVYEMTWTTELGYKVGSKLRENDTMGIMRLDLVNQFIKGEMFENEGDCCEHLG